MAAKKPDLISDKARSLEAEIAALEAEIKRLDNQLQQPATGPKFRSTATPHGETIPHVVESPRPRHRKLNRFLRSSSPARSRRAP